ncbi:MAG: LamG-like jellyroll fold domain-containing protein [Cyclobacteriaceae bacterium]
MIKRLVKKLVLELLMIFCIVSNVLSQSSSHSSSFYKIPTNSNLEISGNITLEAWLRPNAAQSNIGNVLMKGSYGYAFGIMNNGTIAFWQNGGQNQGPESTTSIAQDGSTWTHVAVVNQGGVGTTFYINGVAVGSNATGGSFQVVSGDLAIGTQGTCNCNSFNGLIDEVRIWNDVRTASEIGDNFDKVVSGSEQGLAAYYRFNEGSGTTIYDEKTATAYTPSQNSIIWSATDAEVSEANYALDFDGVNDYVYTETTATGLPQGNAPVTVEAWVKTTQTSIGNIVSWGNRTNGQRFGFAVRSSRIAFIGQFNDRNGVSIINDNNWHHVAMTFSGGTSGTLRFYVDGVEDGNASPFSMNIIGQDLRVGQVTTPSTGEFFDGQIDEVRIWDYELTAVEISARKDQMLAGTEAGLVTYYNFDQGAGTTLTDLTANNNNGTLTDFALSGITSNWVATGPALVEAPADITAPTVSITGPVSTTNESPFQVTLTFSEAVTNLDLADLSVANGTGSNLTSSNNTTWTADITPAAEGIVTIDLGIGSFMDNAGNANSAAATQYAVTYELPNYTVDFDGTNDYITIPDDLSLSPTSALTIEAWVYLDVVKNVPIVHKWGGLGAQYSLEVHSGKLNLVIASPQGGMSITSNAALSTGQWIHVAGTFDGQVTALYINGTLDKSTDFGNQRTINSGTTSVAIGRRSDGASNFWDGRIDEVRIWNKGRSASEISANLNQELNGTESGLVAYYNFNQSAGTTISDITTNNNDGTLTDFALTGSTSNWVTTGPILEAAQADVTPPTLTITTTETGGTTSLSPFPVTITFDESVTGFDVSDLSVTNGTATNFTSSGVTYTADIYPTVYGQVDVDVAADVATDASANGNIAATTFSITAMVPENALDFDGTDDFVSLTRSTLATGLTLEAWIRTSSNDATSAYVGNTALTVIGDNTNNIRGAFGVHAGKVRYTHWTGSGIVFDVLDGVISVNDGNWHHIAITHDQSSRLMNLYVDGVLDASATSVVYRTDMAFNRIGGSYSNGTGTGDFFAGQIDDVRVWNIARSEEDILGSLTDQIASAPGLVASYGFNHTSGTLLSDLSGNGNTGTLTNFNFGVTASDWIASTTPECAPLGQFIGAVDANWNDPNNWCGGVVPAANNVAEDIVVSTNSDIVETQPLVLNANKFQVKEGASLTLNLSNNDVDLQNAATFTNNGTVNIANGTNVNASSGVFTNNGTVNVQTGTGVNATTGSFVNKGTFFFEQGAVLAAPSGTFINEGRLKGFATVNNNFENPALGTVAPGASPGCMDFVADFTNSGLLEVDINGTTSCTGYDQITVGGTANLDGTLTVILGYVPVHADSYVIIDANAISGTFTTVNLPDANWNIQYDFPATGQVSLTYFDPNASFALDFDGVNDKIIIADNPSLEPTGGRLTVEAWIYNRVDTYKRIITKGDGSSAGIDNGSFIFDT